MNTIKSLLIEGFCSITRNRGILKLVLTRSTCTSVSTHSHFKICKKNCDATNNIGRQLVLCLKHKDCKTKSTVFVPLNFCYQQDTSTSWLGLLYCIFYSPKCTCLQVAHQGRVGTGNYFSYLGKVILETPLRTKKFCPEYRTCCVGQSRITLPFTLTPLFKFD